MKIRKHTKLHLRLLSFIICFILLTETFSGHGIQTVNANQPPSSVLNQTTSSDSSIVTSNSSYSNEDNDAATSSDILSSGDTSSSDDTLPSDDTSSSDDSLFSDDTSSSDDSLFSDDTSSSDDTLPSESTENGSSSNITTDSVSNENTSSINTDESAKSIALNEINFPDAKFLDYIYKTIDLNKDYELSEEECFSVTNIEVSHLSIQSLEGLEYFTNLSILNCSNNQLVDLKLNTFINLTYLNCSWNQLTHLDLSNNPNLKKVDCIANARAIQIDADNRFDLSAISDFQISSTNNWSVDYTVENNIITFPDPLNTSVITFTSNYTDIEINSSTEISNEKPTNTEADNETKMEENTIIFTLILYKDTLDYIDINEITFPDTELRNLVSETFDINNDNILDSEERNRITNIDISPYSIADLTGLQHFVNLTYFNYSNIQSNDIDTSILPAYTKLYCDNSPITSNIESEPSETSDTTVDSPAIEGTQTDTDSVLIDSITSTDIPNNTVNHTALDSTKNSVTNYTITYVLNGGTNPSDAPTTYKAGETVTLPVSTKPSHQFNGWYLDSNFSAPIASITSSMSQNITLYAKWTQLSVNSTTSIKKLKASKKGRLTITYHPIDGISGYEVLCSTSKKFKRNIRTSTTKKTKLTVKGLIKNKTYYVKVRGYLIDSTGEKVYGKYSAVKKLKIKKGVSEVKATSTSAKIKSCKITNSETVTIKAKASNVVKSKDSYYYLFSVPSTKNSLKKLRPIAKSEKSTSMTFKAALDKDGSKNLLHSKFVIAVKQKSKYQIISAFRYISNPEAVAKYNYDFPTAPSKKGLQGYSSSLGINHTILNLEVNDLIATESEYNSKSTDKYSYKGKTYYFRRDVAKQYAYTAREYSENGAVVYAILLLSWSSKTHLITPKAREYGYPYYAWNTKNKAAKQQLEATITYFAEFCCKVCKNGPGIAGWIVGNEVDNFDTWNYAGTSDLNSYTKIYADTFRLVYNATKSVYSNARVYVSLDHMWAMSNEGSFGSKKFLETFNSILASEGNIDWDIAYHPYPVPLTEPDFWNNDFLSNNENSPIINIKNLSVLTNYVKKHYGKDKRIILSEVGFTSTKGQKLQAAAIAYAYYVAEFNPMVDAFIMRSLHDAEVEVEQGLNFGIKGKYAYNVYKYMDTPKSKKYTKFALKIIKAKSWKKIVPKYKASKFKSMPNR